MKMPNKIISKYRPVCNQFDESDEDVFRTVRTTRPEPEPEPED